MNKYITVDLYVDLHNKSNCSWGGGMETEFACEYKYGIIWHICMYKQESTI